MARLFYMIGKSSTGKDTIYREVISRTDLDLNPLVMYTTRPIRKGETDGKEYYFVDENVLNELEKEGRVIEKRGWVCREDDRKRRGGEHKTQCRASDVSVLR